MATFNDRTNQNLWDDQWDVLVVPVNCVGAMGAGLAQQAAQRVPGLLGHYRKECNKGNLKPGYVVPVTIEGKIYLLAATKGNWRHTALWPDVVRCIDMVSSQMASLSACSSEVLRVACPPLGAGLGNVGIRMQHSHKVRPDEVRRAIKNKLAWVSGIEVLYY